MPCGSGEFRTQIQINAISETQDSHGGLVKVSTLFANRWAKVEPLQGRELFNAQQVYGQVNYKFTMRYLDGITPKHEIVSGTHIYDISAVINPDSRKIETVIFAKELV